MRCCKSRKWGLPVRLASLLSVTPIHNIITVKVRLSRNPEWMKRGADRQTMSIWKSRRATEIKGDKARRYIVVCHASHPMTLWVKEKKKWRVCWCKAYSLTGLMLLSGPETSKNKRLSLLVTVNIYHLLPACLTCLLLHSPHPEFLQFPMATSWTKRCFSWHITYETYLFSLLLHLPL